MKKTPQSRKGKDKLVPHYRPVPGEEGSNWLPIQEPVDELSLTIRRFVEERQRGIVRPAPPRDEERIIEEEPENDDIPFEYRYRPHCGPIPRPQPRTPMIPFVPPGPPSRRPTQPETQRDEHVTGQERRDSSSGGEDARQAPGTSSPRPSSSDPPDSGDVMKQIRENVKKLLLKVAEEVLETEVEDERPLPPSQTTTGQETDGTTQTERQSLMDITFPPDYNPFLVRALLPTSHPEIPTLMSLSCTPPDGYRRDDGPHDHASRGRRQ